MRTKHELFFGFATATRRWPRRRSNRGGDGPVDGHAGSAAAGRGDDEGQGDQAKPRRHAGAGGEGPQDMLQQSPSCRFARYSMTGGVISTEMICPQDGGR